MSTSTPANVLDTGIHRRTVPAAQGSNFAARIAIHTFPYAATVLTVLAVGLPTMILPFWSDNAIFSTVGKAISEGGFPYVDAWDQKPPSIYLIYAVAIHGPFRLIGNVRAFDLAWTSITVVLLIELGRRWWSLRAGVISGLTYGVTYFTISTWTQLAQPDSFIGLPIVLALLLHTVARGRWWLLVLAGVALGFAFQLRAIMALLIPFFSLPALVNASRGNRFSHWFRDMVWMGVGFVAFQIVLAIYLVIGGAFGEFIAATRFAAGYTRIGGPWQGPEGPTTSAYLDTVRFSFLYWALGRLVLTAPAVIGGIYGAFFVRDRRCQQMLLFVALAYAGIAVQGKFFWYHYSYMLPFLALLAGWAWDRAIARLRVSQPRPAAYGVIGVLAGALLLATPEVLDRGIRQWKDYVRYYTHPAERERFYAGFGGYPASQEAAWYLQRHTEPNDQIYVWGYDPLLYLLSGRGHANRFIYAFPMMSDWAPPEWRDEFIADMQADPPIYFVTQHDQGGPWITGHEIDPADYIAWLPPLRQWLQNNYDLETEIEAFKIYRRRAG
jgi:hypothetical protein